MKEWFVRIIDQIKRLFHFESTNEILDDASGSDCGPIIGYIKSDEKLTK